MVPIGGRQSGFKVGLQRRQMTGGGRGGGREGWAARFAFFLESGRMSFSFLLLLLLEELLYTMYMYVHYVLLYIVYVHYVLLYIVYVHYVHLCVLPYTTIYTFF